MSKEKYYVTTPIYYASGDLHVGHCFCTVLADACARFKRLDGYDVMFLTGSDEHGMKVMHKAEQAGLTPKQFVDKTVDGFKKIWAKLSISYDKFIRTTDEEHIAVVEKVMQKLYDKGYIYMGKYKGLYCEPCETFFSEGQLVNGNCPDCGRPVQEAEEDCYFLKLSAETEWLKKYYIDHPEFLVPESRKNEIFNNFIKGGVQDLCLTRTSFDWGIKAPFDKKHVIYVWCDALLNYISALGYDSKNDSFYQKYWPADVQFIGRDIARFHGVIWPILLHMLDIELPKQIHSTGFLTLKGDKISKSKSNGFDVNVICDRYGADALRYYLLKEGPIYQDVIYQTDTFVNTINSDLCNDLGNLASRTLAMITQYFDAIVPSPNNILKEDEELIGLATGLYKKCDKAMSEQRVDNAIKEIMNVIAYANKYIDITMPWKLNKEGNKERLATVLYTLSETLRITNVLLQSFLIEIPTKVLDKFAVAKEKRTFDSIKKFSYENYGARVEKGEALFPRLDVNKEIEFLDGSAKPEVKEEKKAEKVEKMEEKSEFISIEVFDKAVIKVGKVLNSEKVEGSEKLLKNTVEIGNETRTIVSGIAKFYEPKDIIGKNVCVVTNLKPIKLKGILSEGMILCAVSEDNSKLTLVSPSSEIESGSRIC